MTVFPLAAPLLGVGVGAVVYGAPAGGRAILIRTGRTQNSHARRVYRCILKDFGEG
jgi:hypothetical protein